MVVPALLAALVLGAPPSGGGATPSLAALAPPPSAGAQGPRQDQDEPTVDRAAIRRKLRELETRAKARAKARAKGGVPVADADQVRRWFAVCDHNENGWISFSEAAYSMRFTRRRFQAFDANRDGRLESREFDELYLYSIVHSGGFPAPRERGPHGPPPPRTPGQMLNAYDTDLDGSLSDLELTHLLADYERGSIAVDVVLRSLDASNDGRLAVGELEGLHAVLYPIVIEPEETGPGAPPRPRTVAELFGAAEPRGLEPGSTPMPPRIAGPISHFHRLDLDGDGYISVDDLENLLRPLRSGVRPHAVVNTLDGDGDLRLSREEFLAALSDPSR